MSYHLKIHMCLLKDIEFHSNHGHKLINSQYFEWEQRKYCNFQNNFLHSNTVLTERVAYFILLYYSHKFSKPGIYLNLLGLMFSEHPLNVKFDQVLAEIFEVKDTWYHSFIFMLMVWIWLRRKLLRSEDFVLKAID